MNNRGSIHHKIFYYSLILVAATLPFSLLANSISIIALTLNWLIEGDYSKKIKSIKNNLLFYIFISFYVMHIIGMLYTTNIHDGFFELQKKLSLLVFPFVVFTSQKLNQQEIKNILKSFLLSILISSLICFINAFYRNHIDPFPETDWLYFSYRDLTEIIGIQPTYLALFVSFAILISFYLIKEGSHVHSFFKKIFFYSISFFLVVFLFMISSRTEITAFLIILFSGIIYFFYKRNKLLKGLLIASISFLIFVSLICQIPVAKERFLQVFGIQNNDVWINQYGKGKETQPDVRVLKWKCSWYAIRENWLFGVGTGDVQDILQSQYKKNNFETAFQQKFNSHNQFLETWIGLGVIGLFFFLSSLVVPCILFFQNKNYLYMAFIILFFTCCITESMLERQHGIIFYSLFTSLFAFHYTDKKYHKSISYLCKKKILTDNNL